MARSTACPPECHLAPARTQHRHRFLPDAALAPALPVVKDRVVGWKVRRQSAPAATLAQAVEDGFDHPALGVLGTRPTWIRPREEPLELRPLLVAQIAWIAHADNLPADQPAATTLTQQLFIAEQAKGADRLEPKGNAAGTGAECFPRHGQPNAVGGKRGPKPSTGLVDRNTVSPSSPCSKAEQDSRPQGRPAGRRVKEGGKSERRAVTARRGAATSPHAKAGRLPPRSPMTREPRLPSRKQSSGRPKKLARRRRGPRLVRLPTQQSGTGTPSTGDWSIVTCDGSKRVSSRQRGRAGGARSKPCNACSPARWPAKPCRPAGDREQGQTNQRGGPGALGHAAAQGGGQR